MFYQKEVNEEEKKNRIKKTGNLSQGSQYVSEGRAGRPHTGEGHR